MIGRFDGDYSFLSNFYPVEVELDGIKYPTVENAFQAAKIQKESLELTNSSRIYSGFNIVGPAEAKKMGRKVHIREDWDAVKDGIMYKLVRDKFFNYPELGAKLLSSVGHELKEGNTWHDNYWGDCDCVRCKSTIGQNKLGIILMQVRDELAQSLGG